MYSAHYDVFICHALEDKLEITNELCKRLEAGRLRTWYSSEEFQGGDSLPTSIRDGIIDSNCGLIIVSKHSLSSVWQKRETDLLLKYHKKILILSVGVSPEEIKHFHSQLIDRYFYIYDGDIDKTAEILIGEIKEERNIRNIILKRRSSVKKRLLVILSLLVLILIATVLLFIKWEEREFVKQVNQSINKRISDLEQYTAQENYITLLDSGCFEINRNHACSKIIEFKGSRFAFSFEDGLQNRIEHKSNVQQYLDIEINKKQLCSSFNLENKNCISAITCQTEESVQDFYFLQNGDSLSFEINSITEINETSKFVIVQYENNIRIINIFQEYFPMQDKGQTHTLIYGLPPIEKYYFKLINSDWTLTSIDR